MYYFFSVNYLDIGGKHTSVVLGISGYLVVLPGIISPILTGYIVQNEVCYYHIKFHFSTHFEIV